MKRLRIVEEEIADVQLSHIDFKKDISTERQCIYTHIYIQKSFYLHVYIIYVYVHLEGKWKILLGMGMQLTWPISRISILILAYLLRNTIKSKNVTHKHKTHHTHTHTKAYTSIFIHCLVRQTALVLTNNFAGQKEIHRFGQKAALCCTEYQKSDENDLSKIISFFPSNNFITN